MVVNIISGDTREVISEIDDQSVELIITSPPYGNIIDYNHPDQIGFGQTKDQYYKDLDSIWKHCVRVLHSGCRMIINIGDEFVRRNKITKAPYHIVPHRSRLIQTILKDENMIYTGTIIWKKVNGSASGKNGKILGSINRPRNGLFFVNREYLVTFKKLGSPPKITSEQRDESKFTSEERRVWFRDTWKIPGESQNNHPAMFPLKIPSRLIRMYSFVGETVFDPFCGSGTTLLAAELNKRDSIGIEIGWSDNWKWLISQKLNNYGIEDSSISFT